MYELQGKIKGFSFDYTTGDVLLQLSTKDKQAATACFDELSGSESLSIKIDRYREKRSLNANAYVWKLLTEIGNRLRISKEEVYFIMLKRYGQSEMISVQAHIKIDSFIKYFEEVGEGTVNGKALGIQTETPDQIAKMKNLWGE